jgi:small-conductance mechanosensitive channel
MLSKTIFELGPYNVCFWNIISLSVIIFSAMILRRMIHKLLKRYLIQANIRVEGNKITRLKIISQSVYALALYVGVWSFNINNENVSFSDFLNYNLIDSNYFHLSFFHIIVIVSIFLAARILINIIKLLINRKFKDSTSNQHGNEFVYIQLAKYVVYISVIFLCLHVLEINIDKLLFGSLSLLVGLGLGLQDVFKDMISGIILLFEGNVKVGDIVEIANSTGNEPIVAKILKINVRTTHIETREGNVLIIPNTKLTSDFVENWSHGSELTRFRIPVSVAYGTNTELASRLLKQAAMSHPKVRKTKPVEVRLTNFGDNGLEMELFFWADQNWDVNSYKSEIRFEIDRLFREYQINIPFPQRDIHIRKQE